MEPAEVEQLVRAVKAGNRKQYGPLVQQYQQRIYRYCFHMLGQLQEAEDVTQDVFVKGLERLGQYRENTSYEAWLYRIAYHECLNKLKRMQTYSRLLRIFSRTVPVMHIDQAAGGVEYNAELCEALLRLRPVDRHIILQRIVEERPFEEIAQQLDMSYAAVRKRYERAKNQLKRDLIQKEEAADERRFSY
ncbi:RNA polymerase sigma factor [Paenibacillus paeoniae]|uniref:RNA polymerase sigma factor n=1 Tax=Paenibacillus paeoniae TaxID=2292705 RepID=UPI001403A518|nr:RNA polymerase sigma factor [Paenibacillus paeoniae]